MNPFEFFFSLFGLVLGLAVAVVAGGAADLLRERRRIAIGVLTPMLATVVLFDLSSFWVNAWYALQNVKVAYGPFTASVFVAVIYFFAASVLFPKNAEEWPSLDAYYAEHHRLVIGGMLAANVGLMLIAASYADNYWRAVLAQASTPGALFFYAMLVLLLVLKDRRVQIVGLALILGQIAFNLLPFAW